MAARLEQERLQARKARLIKQNELYRRDLQAESENLRAAVEWIEQGYVFYKAAGRLRNWSAPFLSPRGQKRTPLAKILQGCAFGFRLWRNFGKR